MSNDPVYSFVRESVTNMSSDSVYSNEHGALPSLLSDPVLSNESGIQQRALYVEFPELSTTGEE